MKCSERGKGGNEHMTILRLRLMETPKSCITTATSCMSEGSSLSPLLIPPLSNPPTYSPNPPTLTLSLSSVLSQGIRNRMV